MKKFSQILTFQVFGILILLYLTSSFIVSILEPIQNKLKSQLMVSVVGSITFEQCLEENREIMLKEVKESTASESSVKTNKIKNEMRFIGVSSIIVQLLLGYLFSVFIVRFVLGRGAGSKV